MENTMKFTRRSLINKTVFGAGALGLRALATGLPASFLSRPFAAQAQDFTCVDKSKAQYLIIATSSNGDPLNANVPGTYAFPDIAHAPDPAMAATNFNLQVGKIYEIGLFHAERHTNASHFRIDTSIAFTNCNKIIYPK